MKNFVSLAILLAPALQLSAALVFDQESCCAGSDREPIVAASANHAEELNNLGSRQFASGDFKNAEKNLRESLEMQQAQTDPNRDTLARTLFNLAAVARVQYQMPAAEALYLRSIETRESISGANSPELGNALSGLAMVYLANGRLNDAVDLAQRAVRVSAQRPDDWRQLAVARNTLATLLMVKGDAAGAENLERWVKDELPTRAAGSEEYVNALSNLGTARLRLSNYRQAELDLRAAEAAVLKLVGPDHPMTATIWNNLAKVRVAQGDAKGAEALFEKAIAAWRKGVGPGHPDVASGLTNLASLYQSRKRYAEADRLFQQALDIDVAALGADSLKVANDWNNLGALSAVQHQYSTAEIRLTKALDLAEKKAGANHPDTAGIAVNLAVVRLSLARYADAARLLAAALPVKERVLGSDSPELASLLRLYSSALKGDRNYVAAERADLRATRIDTRIALVAAAR